MGKEKIIYGSIVCAWVSRIIGSTQGEVSTCTWLQAGESCIATVTITVIRTPWSATLMVSTVKLMVVGETEVKVGCFPQTPSQAYVKLLT